MTTVHNIDSCHLNKSLIFQIHCTLIFHENFKHNCLLVFLFKFTRLVMKYNYLLLILNKLEDEYLDILF